MRKSVFSVGVNDAKSQKAAIQVVARFEGIESVSMDMEKKTLTVVGDVDPVKVVLKLRKLKLFRADIVAVGQNKGKGDDKTEEVKPQEMEQISRAHFNAYYPDFWQPYYYYYPRYISVEEDPSSCVIC